MRRWAARWMPEGHTLHRLAHDLTDRFGGQVVSVSSPQGRFADSAQLLDRTTLVGAAALGKHLFVEFDGHRFVHVHLGLIGKFDVYGGPAPAPVGQVRLRLVSTGSTSRDPAYADLRGAPTCELVTTEQIDLIHSKAGPDPLRAGADGDLAWAKIQRSGRPIGALLMDQHVLSGVGNVYRAELLYRHKLHPLRPGNALRKKQWDAMWTDLVELMAEGVVTGRIDTVRPEQTPEAMGRPPRVDDHGGEVYVYRRAGLACLVCGSRVRTAVLEGRNLFWCPRCQRPYRPRAVR
jgi:endonuclease-8